MRRCIKWRWWRFVYSYLLLIIYYYTLVNNELDLDYIILLSQYHSLLIFIIPSLWDSSWRGKWIRRAQSCTHVPIAPRVWWLLLSVVLCSPHFPWHTYTYHRYLDTKHRADPTRWYGLPANAAGVRARHQRVDRRRDRSPRCRSEAQSKHVSHPSRMRRQSWGTESYLLYMNVVLIYLLILLSDTRSVRAKAYLLRQSAWTSRHMLALAWPITMPHPTRNNDSFESSEEKEVTENFIKLQEERRARVRGGGTGAGDKG